MFGYALEHHKLYSFEKIVLERKEVARVTVIEIRGVFIGKNLLEIPWFREYIDDRDFLFPPLGEIIRPGTIDDA